MDIFYKHTGKKFYGLPYLVPFLAILFLFLSIILLILTLIKRDNRYMKFTIIFFGGFMILGFRIGIQINKDKDIIYNNFKRIKDNLW